MSLSGFRFILIDKSHHNLTSLSSFFQFLVMAHNSSEVEWTEDEAHHNCDNLATSIDDTTVVISNILNSELTSNVKWIGIEEIDKHVNETKGERCENNLMFQWSLVLAQ